MPKKINSYSDGGARGNPGPAAIAYMLVAEERLLKAHSQFVGKATNNQAEYLALLKALESAKDFGAEEITCYLDSELVGKQIRGEYSVKNAKLRTLWLQVNDLKTKFKKIDFINVPRTHRCIVQVDKLLNRELDKAKNPN